MGSVSLGFILRLWTINRAINSRAQSDIQRTESKEQVRCVLV